MLKSQSPTSPWWKVGRVRAQRTASVETILALTLALVLSSCGGDSADGAGDSAEETAEGPATIQGSVHPSESDIGVIALRNGFQTASTLTDENGAYRLSNLRPGEYSLIVSGLGFFTDTSVRGLTLAHNDVVDAPRVTLRPLTAAVKLRGNVLDSAEKTPLSGVRISIRCQTGICATLSVLTDADGVYASEIWPDLAAELIFTKVGYHTANTNVPPQPSNTTFRVPTTTLVPIDR